MPCSEWRRAWPRSPRPWGSRIAGGSRRQGRPGSAWLLPRPQSLCFCMQADLCNAARTSWGKFSSAFSMFFQFGPPVSDCGVVDRARPGWDGLQRVAHTAWCRKRARALSWATKRDMFLGLNGDTYVPRVVCLVLFNWICGRECCLATLNHYPGRGMLQLFVLYKALPSPVC